MTTCDYANEEFAARYAADGPAQFVPGYYVMHQMAAQLISESTPDEAEILILGAGGGLEIASFGRIMPHWKFTGVDPSREMLDQAKTTTDRANIGNRVTWFHGYISDAPQGPFDAATCLLTLHFMKDNGEKLNALIDIKKRLKEGSPFILVDLCMDRACGDFEHYRNRYSTFALNSGAAREDVERTHVRLKEVLHTVSPARNEELLREAGFSGIELFYAGLSWRGWVTAG
ncbi:MAG: class I SAM-dependent methyltransferase [Pseudomonadota bacterium]